MSQRPDRAVAGSWRLGLCGLWLSACAGRDTGSDLLSPLGVWMAIGVPRSTTLSDDVGCGVNFDEGADVEWTFICGAGGTVPRLQVDQVYPACFSQPRHRAGVT